MVRTDAAGCTHDLLDWLAGHRLSYSVGLTLPDDFTTTVRLIPDQAWTPAYNADRQVHEGAWVAEVTELLDFANWPKGMRVIVRKERRHPAAQLRLTDADGTRLTAVATNTSKGQMADLKPRHRRRARCEKPDPVRQGTPGWPTCRCTTSTRTASGAPSSRWSAS